MQVQKHGNERTLGVGRGARVAYQPGDVGQGLEGHVQNTGAYPGI